MFYDLILLRRMLMTGIIFAGNRNTGMGMGNCYPVYRVGMGEQGNAAVISRKKDQQKPYPSFFSQLFQFPAFYSRIIRMVNRSFPPVLLTLYANVFNISLTGKTINHYFTDILFLHRLCRFDFPQLPEDAKSRRRSNDGIFPLYRVIRIQDVL